jgi:hypothetical protein
MYLESNGKGVIHQLDSIWRDIIAARGPTQEIVYRIEKLILRLDVVVDKLFIKTVKAHHILLECIHLTEQFRLELNSRRNQVYVLLTRLESSVDDLVRKTHEFRVKAG